MNSVIIGNYDCMVENLDNDQFRNGDSIPEAKSNEDWISAGKEHKPVWCYYDNDPEKGKKYGKLYNWFAVNDPRGLAPKDWHIPSHSELIALVTAVSRDSNSLNAIDQDDISTNKSGFSALFAGMRFENAVFSHLGACATFWSSSEYNKFSAYVMSLNFEEFDIKFHNDFKEYGCTVRCLKESASNKVNSILFKSSRIGE